MGGDGGVVLSNWGQVGRDGVVGLANWELVVVVGVKWRRGFVANLEQVVEVGDNWSLDPVVGKGC